jgi:hypothetical protein
LIENAAGTGGTVGRSFEEIEFLIDACNGDDRLGLCIDTQHLWASGFDYSSVAGAEKLVKEVDRTIGMSRLGCLHFNDSKIELGGNRDRHANIGEGTIGAKGLAPLVGHPKIRDLPLLLEVPGDGDGPRAEDVEAAKKVVAAGIKLYDGAPARRPAARLSAKPSKKAAAPKKDAPTKKVANRIEREVAKKATKKVTKKGATKATKKATSTSTPAKRPTAKKVVKVNKKLTKKTSARKK